LDTWSKQTQFKANQTQNKPNLVRRRRIANVYNTMNYENKSNWTLGQNKPNSNPILSAVGGFRKAKMNLKLFAGKSGHTLPGCS